MSDDLSAFSMMDLFRMEAEERLAVLSQGLVSLEGAGATAEVIEPLMRSAHSLKGAARIVGLDAAVQVAHAMEDCFVAAQKGQIKLEPAHIDALLVGVDLLTQVSKIPEGEQESWQSSHGEQVERLVANLAAIQAGQAVEAASAPRPAPSPAAAIPVPEQQKVPQAQPMPAPAPAIAAQASPPAKAPSSSPSPPPSPGPGPALAEPADRVVRVTAESLTRLMGLAGESLVQTRRFRPFVDSLLLLKSRQTGFLESLQRLEDRLSSAGESLPAAERELLSTARGQAARCLEGLGETLETIEEFARGSEDLSGRLHHEVLASRMRPLADGVRGFPRLVRDVSRQLGKQVKFEIVGETTGVDRDILDGLEAPLNHLIRNALDHGLETPEERLAAGKNPVGNDPAGGSPPRGDAPDRPRRRWPGN